MSFDMIQKIKFLLELALACKTYKNVLARRFDMLYNVPSDVVF